MQKFIFISRHKPTSEQVELAQQQGIDLYQGADVDAFSITLTSLEEMLHGFDGAIVVHALLAMKVSMVKSVGIFENSSRPGVDGKPQFVAKSLVVLPTAKYWSQMREPCPICNHHGEYCEGGYHISCGALRDGSPISRSQALGLE